MGAADIGAAITVKHGDVKAARLMYNLPRIEFTTTKRVPPESKKLPSIPGGTLPMQGDRCRNFSNSQSKDPTQTWDSGWGFGTIL